MNTKQESITEKRTIVVMGGSFNPPTIAHYKIMLAGVEQLGAEKGIFVPTSDKSLRYKMKKAGFPQDALPAELRLSMLNAMCEDDPRLTVSKIECLHPNRWYSSETMGYLQERYPDALLCYLIGSDKLEIFLHSKRLTDFLSRYCYAVVRREEDDIEQILRDCPQAWEKREHFRLLTSPDGIYEISSTAVREKLREKDRAGVQELLHPAVCKIMYDSAVKE